MHRILAPRHQEKDGACPDEGEPTDKARRSDRGESRPLIGGSTPLGIACGGAVIVDITLARQYEAAHHPARREANSAEGERDGAERPGWFSRGRRFPDSLRPTGPRVSCGRSPRLDQKLANGSLLQRELKPPIDPPGRND